MSDATPILTPMEPSLILSKVPAAPLSDVEVIELKSVLYCKLIGLLMYIATGTRPDTGLAVQKLS